VCKYHCNDRWTTWFDTHNYNLFIFSYEKYIDIIFTLGLLMHGFLFFLLIYINAYYTQSSVFKFLTKGRNHTIARHEIHENNFQVQLMLYPVKLLTFSLNLQLVDTFIRHNSCTTCLKETPFIETNIFWIDRILDKPGKI
jgi:hypothetical protein